MLNPMGSERFTWFIIMMMMKITRMMMMTVLLSVNTVHILKLLAISTYKMHEKKTDVVLDKHNNNTC